MIQKLEGFDFDDIIQKDDLQKEMMEEMACLICSFAVAKNPVICSQNNSHLYCFKCMQMLKKCCICNIEFDFTKNPIENFKNTKIRSIITSMFQIKCPNNKEGCDQVLQCNEEKVSQHEQQCFYQLLTCSNQGCELKVIKKNYENHINNECEYKIFECELCKKNQQQIYEFAKIKYQEHVQNCVFQSVQCEKCNFQIQQIQLAIHQQKDCGFLEQQCQFCNKIFYKNQKEEHGLENCYQGPTKQFFIELQNDLKQTKEIVKDQQEELMLQCQQIAKLKLENFELGLQVQQIKEILLHAFPGIKINNENNLQMAYQSFPLKFSNVLKNGNVVLSDDQKQATKVEKGGFFIANASYALSEHMLSLKKKSIFKFKISSISSVYPVRIGVSLLSYIKQQKFDAPSTIYSGFQSGNYIINSLGYAFLHNDKKENGKQVTFSFKQNDIVVCCFDPRNLTLGFSMSQLTEQDFQSDIEFKIDDPKGDTLHPTIILRSEQDSLSFLGDLKEYDY